MWVGLTESHIGCGRALVSRTRDVRGSYWVTHLMRAGAAGATPGARVRGAECLPPSHPPSAAPRRAQGQIRLGRTG